MSAIHTTTPHGLAGLNVTTDALGRTLANGQVILRDTKVDAALAKFNTITDLFESLIVMDEDGRYKEQLLVDATDGLDELFADREAATGYPVEFWVPAPKSLCGDDDMSIVASHEVKLVARLKGLFTIHGYGQPLFCALYAITEGR